MVRKALIIGGAGTGKTTRLLDLLDKLLNTGLHPHDIGFVSFTKAAIRTAIERASAKFNINPHSLQYDGWYKTLHACCYHALGTRQGEILADDCAETRAWFEENLGECLDGESEGQASWLHEECKSDLELSLGIWDVCRHRIEPLAETLDCVSKAGVIVPEFKVAESYIEDYEQAKRLTGKCDFADLLGRFAGIRFTTDGHSKCHPEGYVPKIAAWLCDESQDNSSLMHACLLRLIDPAKWAYFVGDPFQAIYGFSGSDPALFQSEEFEKKQILNQSYRNPPEIVALGELCLRQASDYWDRNIKPAPHHGIIDHHSCIQPIIDQTVIDQIEAVENEQHENVLLLARTNYQLSKYHWSLKRLGIPYKAIRGGSPWYAPNRNDAFYALLMLQRQAPIADEEWAKVLTLRDLPVKFGEHQMLEHGTKSKWKKRPINGDLMNIENLQQWGATDFFRDIIGTGKWQQFFPFAETYCNAVRTYGKEYIDDPPIVVSTIHGAKGMEADSVVLLTTTSSIVARAAEEQRQFNEECRLGYVAVTRTSHKLTIIDEPHEKHRMSIGD